MSIAELPMGAWMVRAHRRPWQPFSVGLYVFRRTSESNIATLQTTFDGDAHMRFVEMNHEHEPSLSLAQEQAQMLMDSLWECGLRPTAGSGSAGAMDAAQKHLADMRALVSHLAKAKLP